MAGRIKAMQNLKERNRNRTPVLQNCSAVMDKVIINKYAIRTKPKQTHTGKKKNTCGKYINKTQETEKRISQ